MPKKMLRIGIFAERHFNLDDSSAPFIDPTNYPISQNSFKRIISNISAKKNFISLLSREEVNKKKLWVKNSKMSQYVYKFHLSIN